MREFGGVNYGSVIFPLLVGVIAVLELSRKTKLGKIIFITSCT